MRRSLLLLTFVVVFHQPQLLPGLLTLLHLNLQLVDLQRESDSDEKVSVTRKRQ